MEVKKKKKHLGQRKASRTATDLLRKKVTTKKPSCETDRSIKKKGSEKKVGIISSGVRWSVLPSRRRDESVKKEKVALKGGKRYFENSRCPQSKARVADHGKKGKTGKAAQGKEPRQT